MFGQPLDLGSNPSVVRRSPKTLSRVDQMTRGDLYMAQTSAERCQDRIRWAGKEIDLERQRSSDEHWGKCKGEHDPKKQKK